MNAPRSRPAKIEIRRFLTCCSLAAVPGILLFALLYNLFPNVSLITCNLELDHAGKIQMYYWNGLRSTPFEERYSATSKLLEAGYHKNVAIRLNHAPLRSLRIDTTNSRGRVKLYTLTLHSKFGKSHNINAAELSRLFTPGSKHVSMQLVDDYVEIVSTGNDPYLLSTAPLMPRPWFVTFGLPVIFSLLSFHLAYSTRWSGMAAISDVFIKAPSTGNNIDALDGLRGVAAIMVVGDHCYHRFTGLGAGGVWIFMTLSGFLLARPFVVNPSRILSLEKMKTFFSRRLCRILPAYYLYITIVYLITLHFDTALRHYLFLEGAGHLWVIPQEMMFYLLIPLVLLVHCLLLGGNIWLSAFFTSLLAIAAHRYLTSDVIAMYGMGYEKLRLYAGIFFSGVAAAYFCPLLEQLWRRHRGNNQVLSNTCSGIGILILIIFLLFSTTKLWGGSRVPAQIYFPWFGLAAAVLLICIVLSKDNILHRLLSWPPLRAIGVVSLSLYLFHPLVIGVLLKGLKYYTGYDLLGLPLFFCTLLLSYLLAVILYSYIERPFVK